MDQKACSTVASKKTDALKCGLVLIRMLDRFAQAISLLSISTGIWYVHNNVNH